MENGKLTYEGHDHFMAIERLLKINKDMVVLGPNVESFSVREMARKIVPKTLKDNARLEYIKKGGKELQNEDDILETVQEVQDYLNAEHEVSRGRQNPRNNNNDSRNQDRNRSNGGQGGETDPAMCRIHKDHLWKDCPLNKKNKNPRKSQEVNSTEGTEEPPPAESKKNKKEGEKDPKKKTTYVRFQDLEEDSEDEDCNESRKSVDSELWDVEAIAMAQESDLHPSTVISFGDIEGKRLVASCLLDQCCTGQGLIAHDLATALGIPTHKGNEKVRYRTQGGDFDSGEVIKIENAILPCLSTNRTFLIELNVIPKELSKNST